MLTDRIVRHVGGGAIMAQWGPMRLHISSFVGKVPQLKMNRLAAEKAFDCLAAVARIKGLVQRPWKNIRQMPGEQPALRMLESVKAVGNMSLTPMAAVAGAISDEVADFLFQRGMTRVIVNNGGDIAVRLTAPNTVRVGLRERVNEQEFDRAVLLAVPTGKERAAFGVATSGLGGRSLTCGIASAVTVIARTASLADAAATAIANASFVKAPGVIRRLAEEMDLQTDIPGIPVTVEAKDLDPETRTRAVSQSLRLAGSLVGKGSILGVFVVVDGEAGMTPYFERQLVSI